MQFVREVSKALVARSAVTVAMASVIHSRVHVRVTAAMKEKIVPLVSGYRDHIFSQVPLLRGPIYHNITHDTAIKVAESVLDFRITTDTPYFALTGELWGIYCEDFEEN